ncbi:MAG: type II toxin-antitoxin system VapC family toxin [Dehalococcoidia bacterium]|nr:type II toxin-antitoxin system VapC family toxin [Dehalococcoidia bacterium]
MPYLIDSDWVIDHLAGHPEATRLLTELAQGGIAISIVTYMEAFQGTEREADPEGSQARLDMFLEAAPVIPFSPEVARRCARLREALRRDKKRVRSRALDLLVAATALEYDLTLVTRNLDGYSDIPDLKLHKGATD